MYRATCVAFITTTPAIMDSKQVLLADSHSLGPRLYLFVILGITSLSLYHLLGKSTSAFLGIQCTFHFQWL